MTDHDRHYQPNRNALFRANNVPNLEYENVGTHHDHSNIPNNHPRQGTHVRSQRPSRSAVEDTLIDLPRPHCCSNQSISGDPPRPDVQCALVSNNTTSACSRHEPRSLGASSTRPCNPPHQLTNPKPRAQPCLCMPSLGSRIFNQTALDERRPTEQPELCFDEPRKKCHRFCNGFGDSLDKTFEVDFLLVIIFHSRID